MDRSTICIFLLICMYCLILYCDGANYGETCSSSSDCVTDSYLHCDSNTQKCICDNGYYVNSNGDGCVADIPHGDSCTTEDTCAGDNTQCNGGACQCMGGYYWNNAACVTKVSLGDVCPNPSNTGVSNTASCSDTHATCQQDGSTYKCRCTSNYFDNNGDNNNGGQCTLKIQLDSTCPKPTTAVPATVTCSDSVATCVADGGGYKCKCPSNYYDNNGNIAGGQCIQKKLLGANCPQPTSQVPNTVPCIDTNARCKGNSGNYKCQCMDGYYDNDGTSNTGGTCTLKVSLGAECPNPTNTGVSNTASCSDTHATCQQESSSSIYTCRCTSDYYDNNGNNNDGECTPKVALGYDCPMADACKQGNSHCVSRTCVCMNDYYDSNTDNINGGQCKARKALGVQCTEMSSSSYNSDQCKDQFATCNSSKICACNSGYHQEGNVCEANKANGEDCLGNTADECSDLSAECRGFKCTCKLSYYDDNGLTRGGKCQEISQLQVGSVVFSEIKTTSFSVSWSRPSGQLSNFVDYYSVQWSLKNSVNTQKSPDLTSSTTTYVVNGVTPGKVYDVKIISHNTQTENGVERTTSVTKEQSAKPNMVGGITPSNSDLDVSDGNLKIVFTAASNGKSGYIVKLFDDTTKIATKTLGQSATTTTIQNYDVDSAHRPLKNGYRYTVKIVTKSETFNNNGNKVVQSDAFEKVIKTVPKAPNRPESGSCGVTTDNSITVSWSPPSVPNGDIVQYYVMVYLGDKINSTRVSIGNETELTVDGLDPGTSYSFKLLTENEVANSTETNFISQGCKTKLKMAEAPKNIQISGVESRSFTVTWDKPGKLYSEENFGYVLQIKDDTDVCVAEILYKCSDCRFGSFQFSQLTDMCTGITRNEQKTKAELDVTITYNASLKPDILYKVIVTAINGAGRGYEAIETEKTLEEVPQKPTSVSITDLTPTSFTVSWSIDEPRPGHTTFDVVVTADTPAESLTKSVSGFFNRNIEVTGLEEYWNYVVKVKATTSKGSMESDTKNVSTMPAAPGRVSEFTITPHPGGIYTQMKISWKAPLLLDMNGVIKEYHFVYNTTKAPTLSTEIYSHRTDMEHIYETMVLVAPETYYYFKVIAINTDNQTGQISEKIVMSPAGIPPNYIEKDKDVVKRVTDTRQNSFTVTLIRGFFLQNEFGTVRTTGLIACRSDNCNFKGSLSLSEFNAMSTWQKTATNGYPTYRITKEDWMDNCSLADISFTVGIEDCMDVADDVYCNGPLEPGSSYMIIAVACTNSGCLLSNRYGPFKTLDELKCKESTSDMKAIIVGLVLGLIILLLIGYSGYITLRLRRVNLNHEQSRSAPNANKQPTYVNQLFENAAVPDNNVEGNDNPESVYTSLNDETRAEKSTYESI